jgi:hypothetical protein
VASLFYVYYERSDVRDRTDRPLVFSFNGGPGSASVWMHIGYTGPKLLVIDDEGFPVRPYGVRDNPHSILDVADIVYIDPVNTGFSRILNDADRSQFFGVNEDVAYLARWIDNFRLAPQPVGVAQVPEGRELWHHAGGGAGGSAPEQPLDVPERRDPGVPHGLGVDRAGPVRARCTCPITRRRRGTTTRWPRSSRAGTWRSCWRRWRRSRWTATSRRWPGAARSPMPSAAGAGPGGGPVRRAVRGFVLSHNLAPPTSAFWKELLRDRGLTVGRLDSRYRGVDRQDAGERYDFDPALTAWNHAFTPAINHYLRGELGWATDHQYYIFGPVHPWNRSGDQTGEQLRQAMSQNPYLHLLVQSGYFDGGTDYFSAKYTLWNMDPAGRLQDRMRFAGYRSGHMMYLRDEDLGPSNQHIRDFILWSPARY